LFLGEVGRPDLAVKSGEITPEDLAGFLFDSLREKIMKLREKSKILRAKNNLFRFSKKIRVENKNSE
jgi:hypothetical protein